MHPRYRLVYLDCRDFSTPELALYTLGKALDFPAWYGGNLDALHDCLGELGPTALLLCHSEALEQLGDYAGRLLAVLWDSVRENPALLIGFPSELPDEPPGVE